MTGQDARLFIISNVADQPLRIGLENGKW